MTRKRFIKLLMSQGRGRNWANHYATFVRESHGFTCFYSPYEYVWKYAFSPNPYWE